MKTEANSNVLLNKIMPVLNELEVNRSREARRIRLAKILILVIVIASFLIPYYLQDQFGSRVHMAFPLVFLFGIIAYVVIRARSFKGYRDDFKKRVIREIVDFFGKNLEYLPQEKVESSVFWSAGFFNKTSYEYEGDDLVRGKLGKTDMMFSEVAVGIPADNPFYSGGMYFNPFKLMFWPINFLSYIVGGEERKGSDGKGRKLKNSVFRGLFFAADFHKNFEGKTVIYPDVAENLLGSTIGHKLQTFSNLIRSMIGGLSQIVNSRNPLVGSGLIYQPQDISADELVKLESPEFEKEFAVFSNNQIEARYILSMSLMQRLLEFKRKTNANGMRISFVNSKVYIALPMKRNLFEPTYFKPINDPAFIQELIEDIALGIEIVDDLNLNTRIWSKG